MRSEVRDDTRGPLHDQVIVVRVPAWVKDSVERIAAEQGRTVASVVRGALLRDIEGRE